MLINLKEILTCTMVLFAVIDIVGSIPIIIDLRQKVGHIQSEKASVVATIIMIAFLFIGESILKLIGIDVYSFAVAGAIVIFFISIEMVLGVHLFKDHDTASASIVPIAFPLIAGAGTMTTILSLKAEFEDINIIIGIILNIILVYLVLKFSPRIERILTKNGISVLRKVFGVILMAIAIKLFSGNIKVLFN
jgi:multiple antibiotic resistance protein